MSDPLFDTAQKSTVTAFKTDFRMIVGDATFQTRDQARAFRQLTYTCMDSQDVRPRRSGSPRRPAGWPWLGIMANRYFPTCWDGVNLDSPDHRSHVAYPESGTLESGGRCPSTHPV